MGELLAGEPIQKERYTYLGLFPPRQNPPTLPIELIDLEELLRLINDPENIQPQVSNPENPHPAIITKTIIS